MLHIAVARGSIETVQDILNDKPSIEETNVAGETPLLSAAIKYDNGAVISCLLDSGANMAAVDSTGRSVLHVANNSNIQSLLHRGADVNMRDRDGYTRLHNIFIIVSRLNVFYPSLKENAKLFQEAGADVNIKNNEGKTPLDLGVESGVQEAVELLKSKQTSRSFEMSQERL